MICELHKSNTEQLTYMVNKLCRDKGTGICEVKPSVSEHHSRVMHYEKIRIWGSQECLILHNLMFFYENYFGNANKL